MSKQLIVKGHTLRKEGRAHDDQGREVWSWEGHGLCSCGDLSPFLLTDGDRKRWHRQHKLDILAAGQ